MLHLLGSAQITRANDALDARLRGAVPEVERIARDASALGALDDADEAERARRLVRLLQGERLPCTPRLEELALVPLLAPGQAPARVASGYAIPLDRPQRFVLLRPLEASGLTARATLEARAERREGTRVLGHLLITSADGSQQDVVLEAPGSPASGGTLTQKVPLPHGGPWTALEWVPQPNAPKATLLGLEAHRRRPRSSPCRSAVSRRTASPSSRTRADPNTRAASSRAPRWWWTCPRSRAPIACGSCSAPSAPTPRWPATTCSR